MVNCPNLFIAQKKQKGLRRSKTMQRSSSKLSLLENEPDFYRTDEKWQYISGVCEINHQLWAVILNKWIGLQWKKLFYRKQQVVENVVDVMSWSSDLTETSQTLKQINAGVKQSSCVVFCFSSRPICKTFKLRLEEISKKVRNLLQIVPQTALGFWNKY